MAQKGISLRVVSGRHVGAECSIPVSGCRVGASVDDDVVLFDDGVAEGHVALRIYGTQVAVEAAGGDIEINGARIRAGTGLRTRLPVAVSIGGAAVELAGESSRRANPGRWKPFVNIGSALGLTTVVLLVGLYATLDAGSAVASMFVPPSAKVVTKKTEVTDNRHTDASSMDRSQAAALLRRHLKKAHLNGLDVALGADGSDVHVRGQYSPKARSRWISVQRWFDTQYGQRFVLVNEARQGDENRGPDIRFDAIWLGRHPYVVDSDGRRHYPGSQVGHGWWLKSIDQDRVVVHRGERTVALDL